MLHRLDDQETMAREVLELRSRLLHDAPIEQAVGILMGARRCCPDQARSLLMAMAEACQADLREVAVVVVQETAGGLLIDFDCWESARERRNVPGSAVGKSPSGRHSGASARDVLPRP